MSITGLHRRCLPRNCARRLRYQRLEPRKRFLAAIIDTPFPGFPASLSNLRACSSPGPIQRNKKAFRLRRPGMRPFRFGILITFLLLGANLSFGTILGTVRGIVHDPEHRPIQGAQVMVRATASDWTKTAVTDENGEFEIDEVPVGEYTISASAPGFETLSITVTIQSGAAPILHFPLAISQVNQRVEVSGAPQTVNSQSSTTETLVSHQLIARTPGADRTDSLSMITDYVPGAYMVHDQLHIRGGHQVS